MALEVSDLRTYMRAEFNILLQGPHGVGKTMKLMEAARQEGLTLKQFNTASLDPFTDLVGVPKFAEDAAGNDYLVSVRPREIDSAHVLFFDELNRADDRTLNAVFELIQFRTINGEPLPNLKCIVAAQNPPDGSYAVQPLDPALVDRFHVTLAVTPEVSVSYLATKFPRPVAQVLSTWWGEQNRQKMAYLSPRRLEYIGEVFIKTKSRTALLAAMPPEGTFDTKKLFTLLEEASLPQKVRSAREAERKAALERLAGQRPAKAARGGRARKGAPTLHSVDLKWGKLLRGGLSASAYARFRREVGPALMEDLIKHYGAGSPEAATISKALTSGVSPANIVGPWKGAFVALGGTHQAAMASVWSPAKRSQVRKAVVQAGHTTVLGGLL